MQYINLNKIIDLESEIKDLLLISIDDQIEIINDKEEIKLTGKILIGGKIKVEEGEKEFKDEISLDIYLTYDEVIDRNSLNVSVNDFNYKIFNSKLILDLSLKIEGLKEIETSFLSQEDNGFIQEEVIDEKEKEREIILDEEEEEQENTEKEILEKVEENEIEEKEETLKEVLIEERGEEIIKEEKDIIEDNNEEQTEEVYEIIDNHVVEEKKSLLKSVFSNKRINEEISWKLHCVKRESSYKEIAEKYNIDVNKLVKINNNETIEEGKLIFLPLD